MITNDIEVAELKAKIDSNEDFVLIDVREDYEYEMFNLKGKHIPLGTLESELRNLDKYKNAEVVVHCRSGMRSASAKQILIDAGFINVRNLVGGVLAWQEAGY